ncbi:MAG: hypothetical protein V2I66_05535 [Halieaceae bacterium]|jgi:hypothetical protein|nr:hypothetical protein [Halieaceae bacterium]
MSTFQNFSMAPDRFMTMAGNVLFKGLLEASRANAKRIFNEISEGKRVQLMNVRLDDDTELRFDLLLDHSEYRGDRLNFRGFREGLASLISAMSEALKGETNIPVFNEQGGRSMLFGIPGVTQAGEQVNVLMLAANMREPGCVQLKLQYMEPGQFQAQAG